MMRRARLGVERRVRARTTKRRQLSKRAKERGVLESARERAEFPLAVTAARN